MPESASLMSLRVLLPDRELLHREHVQRIVAHSEGGAFGFLPRRLDTVLILSPGILTYETAAAGIGYVAVDAGTLLKVGGEVLVSVRRALDGTDLEQLRNAVSAHFLAEQAESQELRAVMVKLETGFLRRFAELQHDR